MNKLEKCLTCKTDVGKLVTDVESGEVICSNCGTVSPESADSLQLGWTKAKNEYYGSLGRSSVSLTLQDKGLSTQVGKSNRDSAGQLLDTNMQTKMKRLRIWDSRIQVKNPSVRNYRTAFTLLNKLKDKLNLSYPVIENAAYIYRKIQQEGMIKGRTISASAAASLYLACREANISRTLDEIAQAADVRRKSLGREYREIVVKLDRQIPPLDYYHCIEKIGVQIGLSERILRQAMRLMERIINQGLSAGKDPMGLAGAVLYNCMILNDIQIRQRDIAAAASVTEVTLRTRAKDLKTALDLN